MEGVLKVNLSTIMEKENNNLTAPLEDNSFLIKYFFSLTP